MSWKHLSFRNMSFNLETRTFNLETSLLIWKHHKLTWKHRYLVENIEIDLKTSDLTSKHNYKAGHIIFELGNVHVSNFNSTFRN